MANEDVRHRIALFADIADSTRLYRRLGESAAARLVDEVLDQLEVEVEAWGGRVLDRIGDELFCRFSTEDDAAACSIAMQECVRTMGEERPETDGLSLRIGFNGGRGLERDGRPTGDVVVCAKRLTDSAKPSQILLTEVDLQRVELAALQARFVRSAVLKGRMSRTRIHELLWSDGITVRAEDEGGNASSERALSLEILVGDRSIRVPPDGRVTLGRERPAEIRLSGRLVSRLHATIEGRGGGFVLIDQSTNGTYLGSSTTDHSRRVHLDDTRLASGGHIGLGQRPLTGTSHTLEYRQVEEG